MQWATLSQAEEPSVPSLPGPPRRQLREFELWSELGRGGMGVVYRAWQRSVRPATRETSQRPASRHSASRRLSEAPAVALPFPYPPWSLRLPWDLSRPSIGVPIGRCSTPLDIGGGFANMGRATAYEPARHSRRLARQHTASQAADRPRLEPLLPPASRAKPVLVQIPRRFRQRQAIPAIASSSSRAGSGGHVSVRCLTPSHAHSMPKFDLHEFCSRGSGRNNAISACVEARRKLKPP